MREFFKTLYNIFVSIDQLGNAMAGGNPDNTISARVGFLNHEETEIKLNKVSKKWWRLLQKVIDFTFYPIDGKGHCRMAYYSNSGHKFSEENDEQSNGKPNWRLAFLSFFVLISCLPLFILTYTIGALVRLFIPRKDNRLKAMKENFWGAIRKMDGINFELKDLKKTQDYNVDETLIILSEEVAKMGRALRQEITTMEPYDVQQKV